MARSSLAKKADKWRTDHGGLPPEGRIPAGRIVRRALSSAIPLDSAQGADAKHSPSRPQPLDRPLGAGRARRSHLDRPRAVQPPKPRYNGCSRPAPTYEPDHPKGVHAFGPRQLAPDTTTPKNQRPNQQNHTKPQPTRTTTHGGP